MPVSWDTGLPASDTFTRRFTGDQWEFPFNHLRLRTWRDTARYLYEGLKDKGYGLPMLMELTMEKWEAEKVRTHFKAEDFVHKNGVAALEQAAKTAGTAAWA